MSAPRVHCSTVLDLPLYAATVSQPLPATSPSSDPSSWRRAISSSGHALTPCVFLRFPSKPPEIQSGPDQPASGSPQTARKNKNFSARHAVERYAWWGDCKCKNSAEKEPVQCVNEMYPFLPVAIFRLLVAYGMRCWEILRSEYRQTNCTCERRSRLVCSTRRAVLLRGSEVCVTFSIGGSGDQVSSNQAKFKKLRTGTATTAKNCIHTWSGRCLLASFCALLSEAWPLPCCSLSLGWSAVEWRLICDLAMKGNMAAMLPAHDRRDFWLVPPSVDLSPNPSHCCEICDLLSSRSLAVCSRFFAAAPHEENRDDCRLWTGVAVRVHCEVSIRPCHASMGKWKYVAFNILTDGGCLTARLCSTRECMITTVTLCMSTLEIIAKVPSQTTYFEDDDNCKLIFPGSTSSYRKWLTLVKALRDEIHGFSPTRAREG